MIARLAFAISATYVAVLFMGDGQFGAAAFIIAASVWLRHRADLAEEGV